MAFIHFNSVAANDSYTGYYIQGFLVIRRSALRAGLYFGLEGWSTYEGFEEKIARHELYLKRNIAVYKLGPLPLQTVTRRRFLV